MNRKTEEAKLRKEGFDKQLILSNYNEEEVNTTPEDSQCFWLELLRRRTNMPTIKKPDQNLKKFHYALTDGSSLT